MTFPNFDNVDLAIISSTLIALVIGGIMVYKGYYTEGTALASTAVTAIVGLAGKSKDAINDKELVTPQTKEIENG